MKKLLLLILLPLLIQCKETQRDNYQGYVEGDNVYLALPNSGVLKKILVKEGDFVQAGQLLFYLDEYPQILTVKQFEAQLFQAKNILIDLEKPRRPPEIQAIQAQVDEVDAQLNLAKVRVQRMQRLYQKHAVAKDTVDEAVALYEEKKQLKDQYEANLRLAQLGGREEQIKAQYAQINAINAQLSEAKWQLAQKKQYAPAAGIIYDIYYYQGEFVPTQQPVLSLLQAENIHIEFFIPANKLETLHLNQKINFACYGCMSQNAAVIYYISPEAQYVPPLIYSRENMDKLVFRIKAKIDHPFRFKPGQPVTVNLS